MARADSSFSFWLRMSRFYLARCVMRNFREATWDDVTALMEDRVLYLES